MERNSSLVDGIIRELIGGEKEAYRTAYFYGAPKSQAQVLKKLGDCCREMAPETKIIRIKGENFLDEMINAVREGCLVHYMFRFIDCDLFVFQEIEAIGGKSMGMQAFYDLMDYFLETHVPVVVTGGDRPQSLLSLEDRIQAQLQGGICCAV